MLHLQPGTPSNIELRIGGGIILPDRFNSKYNTNNNSDESTERQ